MTASQLTKDQTREYVVEYIDEKKQDCRLVATVRYDDQCENGHNTFSITGKLREGIHISSGCTHDDIAKRIPELAPFIKWHLCSSDGPMHYIANTIYHASDKDHWGLRKGERRQIRNGKTGKLAWKLVPNWESEELPDRVDADERPTDTVTYHYVPWCHEGEGKARELDYARSCAVWLEATDEELMVDDLKDRLEARLPQLLVEFRTAVESLGFIW